jgi:exonuclease III
MLGLSVSNQEIKINGYDIVRKDRNRHGGGVAIYITNSINFTIRDDLTDDNLETITLEISKPKAKPFLINSWYKAPNTTLEIFNAFEDLITRMDSENKEIILLGDYNCDWSRLDSNSANAQTNKLAGIAQTFQFQQLISDPTRITANSKTLIDLAFTNKPELINGCHSSRDK